MRLRQLPWYVVLATQLVVAGAWVQHRVSDRSGLAAWVPTRTGSGTLRHHR